MDIESAVTHLKSRLMLLSEGKYLNWSLTDRAAVSALCINSAQHRVQADCAYCHCSTAIVRDGVHCVNCGLVYKSHSH